MRTRKLISFDWTFSAEERRAYAADQDDLHYQVGMVESTWTAGMLKGKQEGPEQSWRTSRLTGCAMPLP